MDLNHLESLFAVGSSGITPESRGYRWHGGPHHGQRRGTLPGRHGAAEERLWPHPAGSPRGQPSNTERLNGGKEGRCGAKNVKKNMEKRRVLGENVTNAHGKFRKRMKKMKQMGLDS